MSLLVQREVLLCKAESTYNTDPTPVNTADAILVENLAWSHEGARMQERPGVRPSLGKLQHLFGGSLMSVTFDVEMKGPGVAYAASALPEISPLMLGCGFAEAIDITGGSEKATYTPASSSLGSVTLYLYQDGILHKITGCRGTVSFAAEAGQAFKASFTMTGHPQTVTDAALVVPTLDTTVPPVFVGSSFTIDSFAAIVDGLNYDMGNEIAMPADVSASDGYGEVQIVGRDVTGGFNPELVVVATEAYIANWKTGKSMALASGTIGSVQYNKFKFDSPAVYYRETGEGDRDGIRTLELGFAAAESSTDDEVTIEFS